MSHGSLGKISVALIALVAVTTLTSVRTSKDDRTRKERSRIYAAAVFASALLLWPVIVQKAVGWDEIARDTPLALGFVWTGVLLVWEMTANMDESGSDGISRQRAAETKQWASIIIGAAWAVGTLLSVIRTGGGQSIQGSKILLASLVLCIAFIVPLSSEGVDARTASSVTLRSAQRAALHYSVGLFIIGISVSCRN